MSAEVSNVRPNRLEVRKARTRKALIKAAQTLIAEGRQNVAILEYTQLADMGVGSFYNHFATREDLLEAAVMDALDTHGAVLDELTADIDDPAEVFATSFRLTGRLHRIVPELSKVVLASGVKILDSPIGLIPRMRRDLDTARSAGRFTFTDVDIVVAIIAGAALMLGQYLHANTDRDDAEATDVMTRELLCMLGMSEDDATRISGLPLPDLAIPAPHIEA